MKQALIYFMYYSILAVCLDVQRYFVTAVQMMCFITELQFAR